jgi:hypothetical protein
MTPDILEKFSTKLIDHSLLVVKGDAHPPRDPDEDEDDEDDEDEEDAEEEASVVREPDED